MKRLLGTMVTAICLLLSNQAMAATQYEAENATLSGGAKKNTNHGGYTGSGFVDGFYNSTSAQASFTVPAPSAGSATVTLRYCAGNGTSANTGLYVNGSKIRNITCNTTSNWDTWANEIETVMLNAGNNTIAYKAEISSGSCINLDYISVQTATTTYTVSYNGNGNTGGTAPVDANSYLQGASVTVASIGTLTRTGYTFAGWNTSANGSGTTRSAGSTFSMGSANVTLYAIWAVNPTYTVTYNGNGNTGGTAPVDANSYLQGASVTVAGIGTLTRTGYSFAGWNTTANGSGISRSAGSTFTMGNANVTLYASWTANPTYTVTYNGNGNTGGTVPVDANSYLQGASVTVAGIGTLTRTGYAFAGWNTAANGSGATRAAGSTFTMSTANVTLYALWTANPTLTFTITNDGHGTTSPSGSVSVNVGASNQITATAASGYQFSNWTVVSGTASIASSTSATTLVTTPGGDVTIRANFIVTAPVGVSALTYAEISNPVTVNAANTIVLELPFTAPSAGYVTVTATGLYGTTQAYTDEQRGLESFITLNSTSGGSLSGFVEKTNVQNGAQYVSETAGFQVLAGSNTVRLIVSPRTTLLATTYKFVKCKMTVVFSQQKI